MSSSTDQPPAQGGANDLVRRTTCEALLITCSDFRFKSIERRFARSSGLRDDYDLIARPGAVRSLVQPRSEAARETLEQEIRALWRIHAFPRIIAVNHLSCRAYDDIAGPDTERALHREHLRLARVHIEELFPGVRAEIFLAQFAEGEFGVASAD